MRSSRTLPRDGCVVQSLARSPRERQRAQARGDRVFHGAVVVAVDVELLPVVVLEHRLDEVARDVAVEIGGDVAHAQPAIGIAQQARAPAACRRAVVRSVRPTTGRRARLPGDPCRARSEGPPGIRSMRQGRPVRARPPRDSSAPPRPVRPRIRARSRGAAAPARTPDRASPLRGRPRWRSARALAPRVPCRGSDASCASSGLRRSLPSSSASASTRRPCAINTAAGLSGVSNPWAWSRSTTYICTASACLPAMPRANMRRRRASMRCGSAARAARSASDGCVEAAVMEVDFRQRERGLGPRRIESRGRRQMLFREVEIAGAARGHRSQVQCARIIRDGVADGRRAGRWRAHPLRPRVHGRPPRRPCRQRPGRISCAASRASFGVAANAVARGVTFSAGTRTPAAAGRCSGTNGSTRGC